MHRRLFALLLVVGLAALCLFLPSTANAGVTAIQTSFTAADGVTRNAVTVWTPNTPGLHPTIVFVHGGGFSSGDRLSGAPIAQHYSAFNYITVGINYRLTAPRWTNEIDDVKAGMRWVKNHAAQYKIDPSRIALVGASAGGNLALLAAAEGIGVRATVSLSGPTNFTSLMSTPGFTSQSTVVGYLGCSLAPCRARYAAASPVTHVTAMTPPALLVHGQIDSVPSKQGNEYVVRARALGSPATLFVATGKSCHAIACLPYAFPTIDRFLAARLGAIRAVQ